MCHSVLSVAETMQADAVLNVMLNETHCVLVDVGCNANFL